MMQYRVLPHTDITVSAVALGAWGIGSGALWSDQNMDVADLERLLEVLSEVGINYIDTAPVYGVGKSEQLLGQAMKGRRDQFVLQTKCSLNWRNEGGVFEYIRDGIRVNRDLHPDAIRKDIEDSLRRLNTDYIDVCVVHRQTERIPREQTMEALLKLRDEGKIRAIGISNSKPSDLEDYWKAGPISLVQEKLSPLDTKKLDAYLPVCKSRQVLFQAYGVLEQGALTGQEPYFKNYSEGHVRQMHPWYREPVRSEMLQVLDRWERMAKDLGCSLSNLVQAWALGKSSCVGILVGMRRPESAWDTVRALSVTLTDEICTIMQKDSIHIQSIVEQTRKSGL